jgi:Ig-like domain from next to BRCA1 gene
MFRINKFAWLLTAVIMLGLTACGGGKAPTPTLDPAAVYTAAVETAYAQLTQTALSITDTPQPTPTPTTNLTQAPTNTPLITNTPLPGLTPLATNTPFSLTPIQPTQATCDNLLFLGDVTVPDGSEMNPGEVFDKTWSIQNLGPCTWNTNYHITYGYGDVMGNNYNFFNIFTAEVKPGSTVEVTITLTAPKESGTYKGYWTMANDKNYNFGTILTVVIKVP